MLRRLLMAAVLGGLVTTGCATNDAAVTTSSGDYSRGGDAATDAATDQRLRSLEDQLNEREARIAELEGRLSESAGASDTVATVSYGGGELFPPNAKPGECYARVLLPEQYRTWEEEVLVREAAERIEIDPARYEDVTERVLVKEASTRLEIVPAVYDTVTEQVLVKTASTKVVEVPATYRTVTEQVLDKPAYTVWKKGDPGSFGDSVLSQTVNATGELMCLVEVPATYKTVSREVVDTPARTEEVEIPAEYRTVERRVVVQPATTREVEIPAVYEDVTVTRLVEPARERRIEIPAEYRTVTRSEKVADADLEWQEVLCDINATRDNVMALQSALQDKGYSVTVDGMLGPGTIRAVNSYAATLGIPQGANYVPVAVLDELGLDI